MQSTAGQLSHIVITGSIPIPTSISSIANGGARPVTTDQIPDVPHGHSDVNGAPLGSSDPGLDPADIHSLANNGAYPVPTDQFPNAPHSPLAVNGRHLASSGPGPDPANGCSTANDGRNGVSTVKIIVVLYVFSHSSHRTY